jgi:hypothetical protein
LKAEDAKVAPRAQKRNTQKYKNEYKRYIRTMNFQILPVLVFFLFFAFFVFFCELCETFAPSGFKKSSSPAPALKSI